MGLFKKASSASFLGVDIGTGGIKVVELANDKGRAKLMTYGYSERLADQTVSSPLNDPKGTGKLLADILKSSGVKAKKAMAALPAASVFNAIISVPMRKTKKEMKPLIDAEAAKLTPIPMQEMITYSTFIDEFKEKAIKKESAKPKNKKEKVEKKEEVPDFQKPVKEVGHLRVLVTGGAKTLVQKYIDIFRNANLELDAIDTESFALIRSLVGKDRSSVMIIDIGFNRTNLTVVEKGIPVLTRSINVGGQLVTKKMMEQMKVDTKEAEQLKRDLSAMALESGDKLPVFLDVLMQPLLHEIRYSFQLYANSDVAEFKKVDKIILTGGSAHLPLIADHLADILNVNTYLGDPWARITYPEQLRPVLDEIGPRMSVAIGLAMREIE